MLNWLSYPRGVFASLVTVVWTAVMSVVVLSCATLTRQRRIVDFFIVRVWSDFVLFIANVKVQLRLTEEIKPEGEGFLILFNHSSHMDIPVLFSYFPRSFRYGAKIELFRIPFFGKAMELVGVLPIDRRNRNRVMKIYEAAIARVKKGEVFALAPEGTRQPEPKLGVFKRGPFEFAINAQMDIVPVVLAGTYEVLPKGRWLINAGRWSRPVIMQVLPKVSTKNLTLGEAENLTERVRAMMEPVHQQLCAELLS